MTSRRTSFHISEDAEKIVAENGDQAKRINFLINACADLMQSPEFTEQEWMILAAAANGFVPAYKYSLEIILHSYVSVIPCSAIFGAEYDAVNKEELAQKYWSLPLNQRFFVYEIARKFWLPKQNPISSYRVWLLENGAIVV